MITMQVLKHIYHWQVEAAIVSKVVSGKCSAGALKVRVLRLFNMA